MLGCHVNTPWIVVGASLSLTSLDSIVSIYSGNSLHSLRRIARFGSQVGYLGVVSTANERESWLRNFGKLRRFQPARNWYEDSICHLPDGATCPTEPRFVPVAVGTPVARRPPRRSQRAELPHWAPASGSDAQMVHCLPYPLQRTLQVFPALCPGPGLPDRIPLGQSPSFHSLRRPWLTTTLVRALPR